MNLKITLTTLFYFSVYFSSAQNVSLSINSHSYPLSYNKTIEIEAKAKTLHIAIVASENFSYQLGNYESEWHNCKGSTFVNYNNLSGGNYLLKIVNNKTKQQITNIPLRVAMPFWRTWGFMAFVYLIIFFIATLIIFFFFQYRFRQQTKLQRIRNEIASDLHDDVGATLSSIALSSNLINRKIGPEYPELQKMLTQIKIDSEETIHTIRDTVWTINPDNDSFEKLIEKLRAFGFQIFSAKEIEFTFDNKLENLKSPKLSMEQRRNAYLILREVINNIAKHANALKVIMNIEKEKEGIKISLKDDGKGFDKRTISEGNGLKNFKKRAQQGLMDFKITTEIGEGTQVTLLIREL